MKASGARFVVEALEDEGVRWTFGIPGTHNIELYDALGTSDRVFPVLVTDEQSAPFMADGLWRATGELACVNVVPGAGLTHALSGIAEAFMDQVPMLVLGCGIRLDSGRAFQLHDVDQRSIVAPVVKAAWRVERGEDLYRMVRDACSLARSGVPGPVFVEVPADLYLIAQDVPRGYRETYRPPQEESREPDLSTVEEVARRLREGGRTLLYVGAGCLGDPDAVRAVAEALEAPVATTFQGKGLLPESHPLFLWPGFGASAPPFVRKIAASCDRVLAVGCRFAEVGTGSYGFDLPGPLIHVDLDPGVLGRNYPAEVAVVADGPAFLRALAQALGKGNGPDGELRGRIAAGHAQAFRDWEAGADSDRVSPARLLRALQERLGPSTVYATDSGNGTFLAMEMLRLEGPRRFLAPVDYSCMGYSVPAAIGAGLADPGRPVVALAGDGAFLMTGLELLTAVREGVGVIVVVLRDRELAQIAQFQATALSRKVASELPPYDLEGFASGLGTAFLRLDRDEQIDAVVAEAQRVSSEGRPVLVDAAIDYSTKTWFTRGVVKANLGRLPLREQARFIGRAVGRKLLG